jgi:hypothetical protein
MCLAYVLKDSEDGLEALLDSSRSFFFFAAVCLQYSTKEEEIG